MKRQAENPWLWIQESDDEDGIFMPLIVGTIVRAEWDKAHAKKKASLKGKGERSLKGKGEASVDDDDDDFMPPFGKKARAA